MSLLEDLLVRRREGRVPMRGRGLLVRTRGGECGDACEKVNTVGDAAAGRVCRRGCGKRELE